MTVRVIYISKENVIAENPALTLGEEALKKDMKKESTKLVSDLTFCQDLDLFAVMASVLPMLGFSTDYYLLFCLAL